MSPRSCRWWVHPRLPLVGVVTSCTVSFVGGGPADSAPLPQRPTGGGGKVGREYRGEGSTLKQMQMDTRVSRAELHRERIAPATNTSSQSVGRRTRAPARNSDRQTPPTRRGKNTSETGPGSLTWDTLSLTRRTRLDNSREGKKGRKRLIWAVSFELIPRGHYEADR